MGCGSSFKCHKCGKIIRFSGSKLDAVRKHYWKHHKPSMMKKRHHHKKKRRK